MKLYIPEHLKSVPVIKQLWEMVKSYSNDLKWNSEIPGSFDDYQFSLKTDPVISFLDLVLPKWVDVIRGDESTRYDPDKGTVYKIWEGELIDTGYWDSETLLPLIERERKKKINYLSSLLYSVKGTFKVLEYLKQFGILGDSKILGLTYTTKSIEIRIDAIKVDRDLFFSMLEAFLGALLYFEELTIKVGESKIELGGNLKVNIDTGEFYYIHEKVKYKEG